MTISLAPDVEAAVLEGIESGQYGSVEELIVKGLEALGRESADKEAKLHALRRDVEEAILDIEQNGAIPLDFDELKREARRRFAERL